MKRLWLAANEQLDKIKGRKAVIVLTDGIDSGFGRITGDRAFRALVEAEVATYVVSKTRIDANKEQADLEFYQKNSNSSLNKIRLDGIKLHLQALTESEKNLTRIAEETGGRIFLPERFEDLGVAYQQSLKNCAASTSSSTRPAAPSAMANTARSASR
jgi:hypothetical protein